MHLNGLNCLAVHSSQNLSVNTFHSARINKQCYQQYHWKNTSVNTNCAELQFCHNYFGKHGLGCRFVLDCFGNGYLRTYSHMLFPVMIRLPWEIPARERVTHRTKGHAFSPCHVQGQGEGSLCYLCPDWWTAGHRRAGRPLPTGWAPRKGPESAKGTLELSEAPRWSTLWEEERNRGKKWEVIMFDVRGLWAEGQALSPGSRFSLKWSRAFRLLSWGSSHQNNAVLMRCMVWNDEGFT